MATGKPAFPGDTHAEVMTRILRREPAPLLGNVPDATATLDRVVRTCLAKDPEERWHSAHDVAAELRWIAEGEGPAARRPPQATGRLPMRFRSAVALAALLATLGGVGWLLGRRLSVAPAGDRRVRFDIRPEPGSRLLPDRPALSPDGQTLVFTASGADGHSWLWRRALAEPESRPLARSNGLALPFWSPDGRFVAFETGDKLMKIPAAGGPPQQLATTAGFYGGTWSRAGMILFCPGIKSGLFLVSGEGGPTTPATTPDLDRLETAHLYPHFLPDGKRFVFLVLSPRKDVRGIYLGELGSRLKTRLTEAFSAPSSTPEGRLLYGAAGQVLEQDLNLATERLDGVARPVAEDLYAWGGGVGHRAFSCENGVLAWRRGGVHRTRLAWFDRQGRPLEEAAPPNDYQDFALSPDGQRIVASVIDESGLSDLWLIDLERTISSRLTTDASDSFRPVFFADGRRIAFTSLRGGTYDVFTQDIASVDAARPLVQTEADEFPQDVSPDGQSLIFSSYEAQGGGDLFSVAVSEKASYVPLVVSRWHENGARFSPSGNHFAYASWESGLQEIYVKPFPQGAERSMLSSGGGASPFWRRDGRELFYLSPDGMLMSVEVHAQGRAVAAGKPRALFMTATPGREAGTSEQGVAGLSPDGQQFLLKVPVDDAGSERIALEIRGPRR